LAGTIVVDRIESDASYASTINVASQVTFSNTAAFTGSISANTATFTGSTTANTARFVGSTSGTTTVQATAVAGTTTLTLPASTDTLVGKATTDTLTNKRITVRANSLTTNTSPFVWNSDNHDQIEFTALANALTINADAGTPTDGQKVIFRIQDSGVARVLTFTGTVSKGFRRIGVDMVVSGNDFTYTTTAGKTIYFGCIYNSGDARWDIVALVVEA
jgi:hypothetical protein